MTEADIVIIACGYESNGVPILDCMGSRVPLLTKTSSSDHNKS